MGDGGTCSEMSDITVDSGEIVRRQTLFSNPDYADFEGRPTRWTNEKHCLYLNSMEASFVNELHCSMGLLRGLAQKKNDLYQQRKGFRDGFLKNVSVYEYGSKLEAGLETRAVMRNPWIKHFRRTDKHQAVEAEKVIEFEKEADLDNKTKQSATSVFRQDLVGSNTEMSGQNFLDNDEPMKTCSTRRAKRKKMEANNTAVSDRVVPKDLTTSSECQRMAHKHRC